MLMSARSISAVLAFVLAAEFARGEDLFLDQSRDPLVAAYYPAERDLQSGKDRRQIAKRLEPIVDKNPKSIFYNLARKFVDDLDASREEPPKADTEPDKRLGHSENWAGGSRASAGRRNGGTTRGRRSTR